jgi:OmcA/MtrC family decaheme c-type cytochrome
MNGYQIGMHGKKIVFGLSLLAGMSLLAACSGDDGANGPAGPQGVPGTSLSSSATELTIKIDGVTVASPPVVNFTVTNEAGQGFTGFTNDDGSLRFNIAKLTPGSLGDPSTWQNYIESVSKTGAMRGSQERSSVPPKDADVWGELVNHEDGSYTYTFETDITNVTCPDPCTTADDKPLDVSYQPGLTHRVTIQQGNSALPQANAIFDFVPAGGSVTTTREIVKTENCNVCHDKITAHGSRFETRMCVTCHNPGSWADSDTPVDFKIMIHKIHRGENLPSGGYAVGSHDFSDVVFPQDIRNCTKCHDGDDTDTPQGNNWQVPSMEACGSCHEDIDFSKDGSGEPPAEEGGHPGGIETDNSNCLTCHAVNKAPGSVAKSHTIPGKAERAFFQFNILQICDTDVKDGNQICPPGSNPTVRFSVTDPSGATTHEYGNAYNIIDATTTDPEYQRTASKSAARLSMDFGWDTHDYSNETIVHGNPQDNPAYARQVNLLTSAAVTHLGNGVYLYDGAVDSPVLTIPANAAVTKPIGSAVVGIEGRGAAPVYNETLKIYEYTAAVAVNSPVEYVAVNDAKPFARRKVVDAITKCDRCHDVLSVHGGSRNNNGQLCVICHNSSNTDVKDREARDAVYDLPVASTLNGKTEESIDFKRMIHGIHSAAKTNYDGAAVHGFRENGLLIGSEFAPDPDDPMAPPIVVPLHDFSDVRFPGVLSKCRTCHIEKDEIDPVTLEPAKYDTYTLEDHTADGGPNWELPSMSGILGSTVHSYPSADPTQGTVTATLAEALLDHTDDYKYSPIASVCTACHDSDLEMAHMKQNGALLGGSGSEQAVQETNIEGCPVCHGTGKLVDVELVHDQAFANFLGEIIP